MSTPRDETPRQWPNIDARFVEDILLNLSHALRTPLTVAKGNATSLLHYNDRLTDVDRRAMVHEIDLACDHLERVIEHMLQAARLMQGTLPFHPSPHHLLTLTRTAIAQVERALPNQRPGITLLHDETQSTLVAVDTRLLTTTLRHLLANARHFSPAAATITVTIQATVPRVQWSVQDQGIGIAPDDLPYIFDPFYRVATELHQEASGLGLGLTFCQRVIALHGGTLHATSQLGTGSRFGFDLPLAAEA